MHVQCPHCWPYNAALSIRHSVDCIVGYPELPNMSTRWQWCVYFYFFEYFITEFTISVCTFLFEENLFWLLSTISLPMLRRLCACAFVVQPILARHLVMCASVYVRVSISTAVTHQSSKQITGLFNYWTLLAVWIYKHTSGHTLIQA